MPLPSPSGRGLGEGVAEAENSHKTRKTISLAERNRLYSVDLYRRRQALIRSPSPKGRREKSGEGRRTKIRALSVTVPDFLLCLLFAAFGSGAARKCFWVAGGRFLNDAALVSGNLCE